MKTISVTRMELLSRKAQLSLAVQGAELLEQKRAALMKSVMQVVDVVMAHSETLYQAAAEARQALARTEVLAGREALESAALASVEELTLEVTASRVMGVRVPRIEQKRVARSPLSRGYSIVGTSLAVDEAAAAFEAEVDAIIRLAQSELHLNRLADEIRRTTRRLNALNHLLIPNLQKERDFIEMALEERERADHFRLKRVKGILASRRPPPNEDGIPKAE